MRFKSLAEWLLLLTMALVGLTFHGSAAQTRTMPPVPPGENQPPVPGQPPPVPEDIQKEMAKRANQERQAQLRRDTDHLFKLATELKQYVDKSSENTLSLEVVKKADEIEKLAHSVKEKMKGN